MTIVIPHWVVAILGSWWFAFGLGLSIGFGTFAWFVSKLRFWA